MDGIILNLFSLNIYFLRYMLIHVALVHSFYLRKSSTLYENTIISLFTSLLAVDIQIVSWFCCNCKWSCKEYPWACLFVEKSKMSLVHIPRTEMAESCAAYIVKLYFQINLQSGCTNLTSHQQCSRVHFPTSLLIIDTARLFAHLMDVLWYLIVDLFLSFPNY